MITVELDLTQLISGKSVAVFFALDSTCTGELNRHGHLDEQTHRRTDAQTDKHHSNLHILIFTGYCPIFGSNIPIKIGTSARLICPVLRICR
jgi:hypothetical protein